MPEDRGLVPELTVEENILIPLWVSPHLNVKERLRFVYGVLPEVEAMLDRKALLLSGGQQKLVALARALVIGTKLLLLDEPFEGVAPALSIRLSDVISGLRDMDLSVLIAQSDLNHSSSLVSQEVVIERGANVA
jgi:branched-chain amino acid transport system ATP-binding protein